MGGGWGIGGRVGGWGRGDEARMLDKARITDRDFNARNGIIYSSLQNIFYIFASDHRQQFSSKYGTVHPASPQCSLSSTKTLVRGCTMRDSNPQPV